MKVTIKVASITVSTDTDSANVAEVFNPVYNQHYPYRENIGGDSINQFGYSIKPKGKYLGKKFSDAEARSVPGIGVEDYYYNTTENAFYIMLNDTNSVRLSTGLVKEDPFYNINEPTRFHQNQNNTYAPKQKMLSENIRITLDGLEISIDVGVDNIDAINTSTVISSVFTALSTYIKEVRNT